MLGHYCISRPNYFVLGLNRLHRYFHEIGALKQQICSVGFGKSAAEVRSWLRLLGP